MDRAMLQKVSTRWNDYGFSGASPVAGMIDRLSKPEVRKTKKE
jgi:4-hydroxy-3-polyprenylbenzoate decarboxylase